VGFFAVVGGEWTMAPPIVGVTTNEKL